MMERLNAPSCGESTQRRLRDINEASRRVVDFLLLGFYRQHDAFKLFKLAQKIQHLFRRNLPDEFA